MKGRARRPDQSNGASDPSAVPDASTTSKGASDAATAWHRRRPQNGVAARALPMKMLFLLSAVLDRCGVLAAVRHVEPKELPARREINTVEGARRQVRAP